MKVKETSSKYGAVIINCNCIHEFQDRTYVPREKLNVVLFVIKNNKIINLKI